MSPTRPPGMRSSALMAALYAASGALSLVLPRLGGEVPLLWLPSGVALALTLLMGSRALPGVALGAFLLTMADGHSASLSLLIACGDTLEVLAGWWLLTRVMGFDGRLERVKDVLRLGLTALTTPVLSASTGVLMLLLLGVVPSTDWRPEFRSWWMGNTMGILLLAPVILTWRRRRAANVSWTRVAESALMLVLAAAVVAMVYGLPTAEPLAYTAFPLLILTALLYQQRWVATAALAIAVAALLGTAEGRGPFTHAEPALRLAHVYVFIGIAAVSSLVMGAVAAERRSQAEALRRSEARHRETFENAPVGMFRSTTEGAITSANAALAAMLGYSSTEELLKLDLATAIYVNPAKRGDLMARFADADRYSGLEIEWHRKDGAAITVRLSGRALRNEHGRIVGYEDIVEDVTRERDLELQLRQAQKMESLGMLTGGMAHDFNNLLTAVMANAELVAAGLRADADAARSELEEIRQAARRGAELIKKLLAFSRRERLVPRSLDLRGVVDELTHTLRRLLPETIRVVREASPALPHALADPGAVQQIVINLATNARDAMPEGGSLSIGISCAGRDEASRGMRASHQGDFLCLSVTDTGTGMDRETAARVFEPFFTTKAPGEGSGLGLAMVYGLVKQQHGFVHVYSEPGLGTAVRVYLPACAGKPEAKPGTPEGRPLRGTETILVVEDEAPIRRATQRVLERYGYQVLVASDGTEGLALFHRNEAAIDLVITDVVMPHLGGPALAEAVRLAGRPVPFLFTSGYTARDPQVAGTLDPGALFISKPWSTEDLLAKVREALEQPVGAY